jgi:hypothetical protein
MWENVFTDLAELFGELGAVAESGVAGPSSRVQCDRFREELPAKITDAINVMELNMTYS